jgi:hypothetical protein
VRIFIDSYGGNVNDAAAALEKFGWTVPAPSAGAPVKVQ